jgi:hypothetical protein
MEIFGSAKHTCLVHQSKTYSVEKVLNHWAQMLQAVKRKNILPYA